jgi:hypothetical protein
MAVFNADHHSKDLHGSDKSNSAKIKHLEPDVMKDIYAFDEYTMAPLRSCPSASRSDPLTVYLYMRDPLHPQVIARWASQARLDWIYIAISFLKLVEVGVLHLQGGTWLAIVTSISWAYFTFAAVVLQSLGVAREYRDAEPVVSDYITGKLPTALIPGEGRKILLGVPENARRSKAWRIVWTCGGIVCAASLVATYTVLSTQTMLCFYTWAGFQVLWLILRSSFFHFVRETENFKFSVVQARSDLFLPFSVSDRILALAATLSRYQMQEHPRGSYCYKYDVQDPEKIAHVLEQAGRQITPFLSLQQNDQQSYRTFNINILAILGDTLLSSATYIQGSKATGMDLYDSCLVLIESEKGPVLVPSVRVLSGAPHAPISVDIETSAMANFVAKGCTNDGVNISWVYWIPCGSRGWLHFRTKMVQTVGRQSATYLTDTEVSRRLMSGHLLISFTSVRDVKGAMEMSDAAGRALCGLLTGETSV